LAGTNLLRRATVTSQAPDRQSPDDREPDQRAAAIAAMAERRVRWLARLARAPRRLGLPSIPGWRDTCLSRACAATVALRTRGIPAALVLGVRTGDDPAREISAHAWVTLDGLPLTDPGTAIYEELKQPGRGPAEPSIP
jgi:hypothetical protein